MPKKVGPSFDGDAVGDETRKSWGSRDSAKLKPNTTTWLIEPKENQPLEDLNAPLVEETLTLNEDDRQEGIKLTALGKKGKSREGTLDPTGEFDGVYWRSQMKQYFQQAAKRWPPRQLCGLFCTRGYYKDWVEDCQQRSSFFSKYLESKISDDDLTKFENAVYRKVIEARREHRHSEWDGWESYDSEDSKGAKVKKIRRKSLVYRHPDLYNSHQAREQLFSERKIEKEKLNFEGATFVMPQYSPFVGPIGQSPSGHIHHNKNSSYNSMTHGHHHKRSISSDSSTIGFSPGASKEKGPQKLKGTMTKSKKGKELKSSKTKKDKTPKSKKKDKMKESKGSKKVKGSKKKDK